MAISERTGAVVQQLDTEIARDYWIGRARAYDGPTAVHPDTKWLGYDTWTRRMLQSWTLGRIHAVRPRYRRCVDLGCGFGDWTEYFARIADEIHACDVAPGFAVATQLRLIRHRAVRVECADLREFQLPRDVDLFYVGAVLMYLTDSDVRAVLRRIRGALAPGGVVVIRDFCAFNAGRRTINRGATSYSVNRRAVELRDMANEVGLRCAELRCSPSIYAEVMGGALLQWPLRMLWRLASLHWLRASYTLILRG